MASSACSGIVPMDSSESDSTTTSTSSDSDTSAEESEASVFTSGTSNSSESDASSQATNDDDGASDAEYQPPAKRAKKHRGSGSLFSLGEARAPYKKTWGSREHSGAEDTDEEARSCGCRVVLPCEEEAFRNMKVSGDTLKRRKRYKPVGSVATAYRD